MLENKPCYIEYKTIAKPALLTHDYNYNMNLNMVFQYFCGS